MTRDRLVRYNEQRPNKSLGDLSPRQYLMAKSSESLTSNRQGNGATISPLNPLLPSGQEKRGGYKALNFSISRRHSITLFHICRRVQGIRIQRKRRLRPSSYRRARSHRARSEVESTSGLRAFGDRTSSDDLERTRANVTSTIALPTSRVIQCRHANGSRRVLGAG